MHNAFYDECKLLLLQSYIGRNEKKLVLQKHSILLS